MTTQSRLSSSLKSIEDCNSWQEVQAKWQNRSAKEKGDFFEDFIIQYLQIADEYAAKFKNVWRHDEVPTRIRTKLNLPSRDMGIDIVAETKDGEFWAIQCKYRQDTDQSLSHTEISTFTSLAFTAAKGFSFALVCSTTERFTEVYQNAVNVGFASLDVWLSLPPEFFDVLRSRLSGGQFNQTARSPRPHQEEAVKDGLEHFVKGKQTRGKLIMPCGAGKSLTAWFLAKALKSKRIVIAVPSLSLIRQTLKDWLRETHLNGMNVRWICVCSDSTASQAEDDAAVYRQDLGIECHTDSAKIAEWLRRRHSGLTVVFTTYHSSETLANGSRLAGFKFDLGILDEAHKTVGDSDKLFSHLLHEENITIERRVFMTATERRYSGAGDNMLSMNDAKVYGDTFHLLSFRKAMECVPPILSDYKIITILVSRSEVAELIRGNKFVRPVDKNWDDELESEMLAALIALRKAMRDHPIRHAVSFHSSIKRSEWFVEQNDVFTAAFPEYGELETFQVSGKTPAGVRAAQINEFARAERSLITNARCLTEGVDVPKIDCVLFADPRKSKVDIVQAVGRALRPFEGKRAGYVILPVLEEWDKTTEELDAKGAFKEVISTLRALAANDDRIVEWFRDKAEGKAPKDGSIVQLQIDERLAQQIDLNEFVKQIELKVWDRLARMAWRPFDQAREFVRGIGLKGHSDWIKFYTGRLPEKGGLPADIPANPNTIYAGMGWINFGDWLGTGTIAPYLIEFREFEAARSFARNLGLRSSRDWNSFCRGEMPHLPNKPSDIPASPSNTYRDSGWRGMGDWLGYSEGIVKMLPFNDAREKVRALGLSSVGKWRAYCSGRMPELTPKDPKIPTNPNRAYGNEWTSWNDWLGTGKATEWRPFVEARAFIHALNLKNSENWWKYCRGELTGLVLPTDIPKRPDSAYINLGWISFSDWLGNGIARDWLPFEEARTIVRGLNLTSESQWRALCAGRLPNYQSLPSGIPRSPASVYKDLGWLSWPDWLRSPIL